MFDTIIDLMKDTLRPARFGCREVLEGQREGGGALLSVLDLDARRVVTFLVLPGNEGEAEWRYGEATTTSPERYRTTIDPLPLRNERIRGKVGMV